MPQLDVHVQNAESSVRAMHMRRARSDGEMVTSKAGGRERRGGFRQEFWEVGGVDGVCDWRLTRPTGCHDAYAQGTGDHRGVGEC